MSTPANKVDPAHLANVVAVFEAHGIQAAAAWGDLTPVPIYLGARAAGLVVRPARGRRPAPPDPRRQLPRPDCGCPMCHDVDHSPEAAEQRERALDSILAEQKDRQARHRRGFVEPRHESWRLYAECRNLDGAASLFFSVHPSNADTATAICAQCPARTACLEYALVNRIEHGIWGGVSERGRRRILRHVAAA